VSGPRTSFGPTKVENGTPPPPLELANLEACHGEEEDTLEDGRGADGRQRIHKRHAFSSARAEWLMEGGDGALQLLSVSAVRSGCDSRVWGMIVDRNKVRVRAARLSFLEDILRNSRVRNLLSRRLSVIPYRVA